MAQCKKRPRIIIGIDTIVTVDVAGYKKMRGPVLSIGSLLGGGYLLSHFRSTIGVVRLNFSVRNGKRWDPHAMTTLFYLFQPGRPH